MTELAIENWGTGSFETPDIQGKPHEAGLLKLSIDKAKSELGWTPRFSSADAVAWTIDWYKGARGDERAFTMGQIDKFFQA